MTLSKIEPVNYYRSSFYPACLLVVAGIFLSDCAGNAPQQDTEMSDKLVAVQRNRAKLEQTLAQQTAANRGLKEKSAKLQLLLLEKEAQFKELSKKLQDAILEVVRVKAKLRSLESKAEAASNLAEAETALKAFKAKAAGDARGPEFIEAEQLMNMSAQELQKQNYGGALYLASQAKSLIKEGQERSMSREKMALATGEVPFALLLPLRLLGTSSVREGPGPDFKVLVTLGGGAPLTGYSYKGQWVRVKSEDGRFGWILYTQVDGR